MKGKKQKGIVLIQDGNRYFRDGRPVDYEKATKKVETVIILPEKKAI